ncbi:MAG: N-6 DNA methylase [Caldilineaceae bacterium]|nr:N-6 DNA methylase [Caldilineaceae bacterium]
MQTIARSTFTAIKTEGGLLPVNVLQRIADGAGLDGLRPDDYHLSGERLNEAISRSWNRCLGAWRAFRDQSRKLAESDSGTTLTRERWLLVLFDVLGYGRLPAVRGLHIGDHAYPISHLWQQTPFHLVSFRNGLESRSEGQSAARRTPHSLMQELLNRSQAYQWGIIANGLRLRLLRDNASLSRSAYVEFDLEAIMEGELYAEFSLFWLICHQSRVEDLRQTSDSAPVIAERSEESPSGVDAEAGEGISPAGALWAQNDGEAPGGYDCWLERWSKAAAEQGTRVLDELRKGVEEAIVALGSGFLSRLSNGQPAAPRLAEALRSGQLSTQGYYQQVRRLVYRLLFLLVAEDRDLLLLPGTDPTMRRRYLDFYSLGRIRQLASASRGGPHPDLYRQLAQLFVLLRTGYAPLGLPGLGSYLFSATSTPDLDGAELANRDLLKAIFALSFTVENGVRRAVDYRNLDTEELGSVYESLLELHPQLDISSGTFSLVTVAGSERKTTGSYYTPTALVNELLNSALEPVIADRLRQAQKGSAPAEAALLSIKVIDFACGSGHMLIGAARRLALHLARIRSGDDEPGPQLIRHALRDVVRHCIYGVDVNATSVELCKVALWMETLEPGKPLGFLDANIRCGNSLVGVTSLEDLAEGIPDDAFTAKSGDDRATMTALRRRNRREAEGQLRLPYESPVIESAEDLARWRAREAARLAQIGEEDTAAIEAKSAAFAAYLASDKVARAKLKADLWTAAFFWPVAAGNADRILAPTQGVLQEIDRGQTPDPALVQGVQALAQRHNFFHWSLEFPAVYLQGGFDVILSNPPWERIKLQEKEWFATHDPAIANAPNAAARRKLIAALAQENPTLAAAFEKDKHGAESESHFVRSSARYPLCGRGDVNTYAIFAELAYQMVHPTGRAGVIVPTGIATDDTTKYYFQEIMEEGALASLYDFENRRAIFPGVHRSYKFALLTLTGEDRPASAAEFVFFALDVADLQEEQRRFTLTAQEIALLNPNTRTVPIFRSQRDAELTKAIYRRVPVLIKKGGDAVGAEENPWGISFLRMFDMSNDSHLFRTRTQLEGEGWRLEGNRFVCEGEVYLPLYEAKMFHHYDHRWATYENNSFGDLMFGDRENAKKQATPRYWVPIESLPVTGQLLGFRRVARTTDERTLIATLLPEVGASDSIFLMLSSRQNTQKAALCGVLNSFVFDYVARQKIGGMNANFFIIEQLPVLQPSKICNAINWLFRSEEQASVDETWFSVRVLELTYTAWDLQPFACDCGYEGPPFRWDEERRFLLRCELDAAYFHLYGIARDDVEYILETFPIVKRKEIAAHGCYRTKETILSIYDEMAAAMASGGTSAYQTRLNPPPADPRVAHRDGSSA